MHQARRKQQEEGRGAQLRGSDHHPKKQMEKQLATDRCKEIASISKVDPGSCRPPLSFEAKLVTRGWHIPMQTQLYFVSLRILLLR